MAFSRIVEFAKANKKGFVVASIITTIISFFLWLAFLQMLTDVKNLLLGKERGIYVLTLLSTYFKHSVIFIPLTLGLAFLLFYIYVTFKRVTRFKGKYDAKRGITILDKGDNGTAKLLEQAEELKEVFNVGKYGEYDDNIFGCVDGEYKGNSSLEEKHGEILVYEKDASKEDNMNLLCIAQAGGGKTRKKCVNDILQCLKRGDSVICTDTKGDLVRLLYRYAHDTLKIPTKIINFKPDELRYSDAVDLFSMIGDYSQIKLIEDETERDTAIMTAKNNCDNIAECIRKNLSDKAPNQRADFWDLEGKNYIRFWVSYMFFNENIPKEKKTFYEMAQRISRRKVKEKEGEQVPEGYDGFLEDLLDEVEGNKVLKMTCSFNLRVMLDGTLTVKNSVHAGLGITLSALDNPLLNRITSNAEVDLSLPAKEQCMYFLVMDAVNKNNNFLIAVILTLMYQQMLGYIDSKIDNHRANQPVWLIYDEFTNIGFVPNIATYLAVVRDQLIRHELFIQSLALARTVYTEDEVEAIKTNCAYWELLGTTEKEVLEIFSEKGGTMTIEQKGERNSFSKLKIINLPLNVMSTTATTARETMMPDEIGRMKKYELLIYKQGNFLAKIHTWDYTNHPEWKKCSLYATSMHVPKWQVDEIIRKQKEAEREKEMEKDF